MLNFGYIFIKLCFNYVLIILCLYLIAVICIIIIALTPINCKLSGKHWAADKFRSEKKCPVKNVVNTSKKTEPIRMILIGSCFSGAPSRI